MAGGDLTVNFNADIDTSWLQLPKKEIPQFRVGEPEKVYARKELARFTYLDKITLGQEAYKKEGGSTRDYVLKVVSQVISVILPALSVLMPLAVCYLPPWVPFGIGLPVILVLSIVQSQIKSRIEIYKREQQFLPYLDGFLKFPTFKAFQAVSQEDLPALDERLKSDEMMHEEVGKKRLHLKRPTAVDSRFDLDAPSYGKHRVATIASRYDFEVSPYLQQAVAAEYAGMPHKREKWKEVCNLQDDILAAAREGDVEEFSKKDVEEFSKKIEARRETAYEASRLPNCPLVDYPVATLRSYLESLVQLYRRFSLQFKKLDSLRTEGEALYGVPAEGWAKYLELAKAIQIQLEGFKQIANHLDEPVLLPDFNLPLILYRLNGETSRMKKQLEKWIAAHPSKRHQALQDKLNKYAEQDVLTGQQLGVVFVDWVKQHPDQLDQTIMDLGDRFPKELKGWIEKHPQMRFETARDLFSRSIRAVECLKAAQLEFKSLKVETQAIDTFEKTVMVPLADAIIGQSEAVEFEQKFKATFTKTPAIAFAKVVVPKERSPLKSRKIEEIDLNNLLRGIDSQMLFTNRARKYGLRIPLIALFAIEGIVAYYLATPWLFWGLCVLAALGEGVSYYIDRKLQEMERKKQAIKLQYILRDYPEISVIPGTKPHLGTVKEVQQKYGLDGVRPTWARILTEDAGTPLETAGNLAEAAEATRELAKEGSEVAAARLEEALLNLYSQQNALLRIYNKKNSAHQKEMRYLNARIQNMEKVLYPAEDPPDPKNPTQKQKRATALRKASQKKREEAQRQYQKRHQLEKDLDGLTRRFLHAANQLAIINFKQAHFDEIAQVLPANLLEQILSQEEVEEYLDKITNLSLKQKQARALQTLVALQKDQEVPTPSTLKTKRESIEGILNQDKQQGLRLLGTYQQDYKSCYGPLARERQLVEEALDKLAENKIYMEKKRKEFRQVSRQFSSLERLLTPRFVHKPVLQAEIDLLLKTLKEDPLDADSTIDVNQLLWGIKEKLNSFPFTLISSNDLKFLAFDKEIEQLRKLPLTDRLMLAKLLRKLQVLQNEKEYESKSNVDNSEALANENLNVIQQEMTLLKKKYDELSTSLKETG